jgi:DNA polymerase-3 subunit delta'
VSWHSVRGHEALREAFERVWRRVRLAHAYLFVGPAGIGKRLFARALAKALLCEALPDEGDRSAARLEACGRCPSCVQVEAGTHPDLFLVGRPEDSNELKIEILRELCRGFVLKSARGRGKVAILDDADDLNQEAANCFLKTLEEPPPRSLFILLGTAAERQLPTITSRCQVVRFAPLPDALVAELLREQGVSEKILLSRLTRLAAGSPGQAQAFAEPALWDFRRSLLEGLAGEQPDTVGLARSWVHFVEEAGKELAAQRRRAALVLRLLILTLQEALRLALGGTPRTEDAEELGLLRRLANRLSPDQFLQLIDRCLDADEQIGRYVQLVLVLEGLLDALGQLLRDRGAEPAGAR